MLGETVVIADRDKQEKLVPVITYVCGLQHQKAVGAWLSFLSVCFDDFQKNLRLPNILSAQEEAVCQELLNSSIDAYLRAEQLPLTVQATLTETVFRIIKGIPKEQMFFLKDRFLKICGEYSYNQFWKIYEDASCIEDVGKYRDGILHAMQLKYFSDFSIFFIALIVYYCCGDEFYERMAALEQNLRLKYGKSISSQKLSLCLWSLDFSFVQNQGTVSDDRDEYCALLKSVKVINPNVNVQVCVDSLLWSRDIIGWLDDDYNTFTKSDGADENYGCGLLSEGGNIVPGTAVNKFILIAQGPLIDNFDEVDFIYELDKRDIRAYTLPDGFIWARNPQTKQDIILDSIHIDTVINVIPSQCTNDERVKIIVDPCYYALIKDNSEFNRFLHDQSIPETDIVIVDERESYLNLPNFSTIIDPKGEKRLLFNKDKGFTLPRLNLKANLLVQPEIEITNISSFFGSIRCATNMLPESLVNSTCPLTVTISDEIPAETKKLIHDQCQYGKTLACGLSKLWVKRLDILVRQCERPCEFDEFSRTAYIYISPDQIFDSLSCNKNINVHLTALAGVINRQLGINPDTVSGLQNLFI